MTLTKTSKAIEKCQADLELLQQEMRLLLKERKYDEISLVERKIDMTHTELLTLKQERNLLDD